MSPTPRRTKKDEAAEKGVETTEAKADAAKDEAAEETTEAPAEKKPRRRRASADAAAAPAPARKKAEDVEPGFEVRAQARYVRNAPRKARLVVDHIRGKSVPEARALLTHTPRAAAEDVLGLLNSAAANAENNHELDPDDMFVKKVFVDEGPTLKRYQPRAQGRAFRIRKRTSHMTIVLAHKKES